MHTIPIHAVDSDGEDINGFNMHIHRVVNYISMYFVDGHPSHPYFWSLPTLICML